MRTNLYYYNYTANYSFLSTGRGLDCSESAIKVDDKRDRTLSEILQSSQIHTYYFDKKGPPFTNTYILLTKREGRSGRISARGLDSTDRAQRGPYKKDRGPKFSQYGPEQDWLIRDLLHD